MKPFDALAVFVLQLYLDVFAFLKFFFNGNDCCSRMQAE